LTPLNPCLCIFFFNIRLIIIRLPTPDPPPPPPIMSFLEASWKKICNVFLISLVSTALPYPFDSIAQTMICQEYKLYSSLLYNFFTLMKNAIFWDVVPCRSCANRGFGGNVGSHKIYRAPHSRRGILHSHRCENLKSYLFLLFPICSRTLSTCVLPFE
jgi:hypothetical protein